MGEWRCIEEHHLPVFKVIQLKGTELVPLLGGPREAGGGVLKSSNSLSWFCLRNKTPSPLRGTSPRRGGNPQTFSELKPPLVGLGVKNTEKSGIPDKTKNIIEK